MPLGTGVDESEVAPAEVHTTTECARRRMTERSCSGSGRASKAASWCGRGWTDGACGGVMFHASFRVQDWESGLL